MERRGSGERVNTCKRPNCRRLTTQPCREMPETELGADADVPDVRKCARGARTSEHRERDDADDDAIDGAPTEEEEAAARS